MNLWLAVIRIRQPRAPSGGRIFHDSELDSLIERAVRSDLDLRIAQARVREARAQYGIASADLWPTVDGSSSYARQRQSSINR